MTIQHYTNVSEFVTAIETVLKIPSLNPDQIKSIKELVTANMSFCQNSLNPTLGFYLQSLAGKIKQFSNKPDDVEFSDHLSENAAEIVLPDEIVQNIMQSIPNPKMKDLATLTLLSKKHHFFSKQILQNLRSPLKDLGIKDMQTLFVFVEKNGAYLRHLSLDTTLAPNGEQLKKILKFCPNLEHLDLCCKNIIKPEDLLCIDALTELKSLRLFYCRSIHTLPSFNRLLKLEKLVLSELKTRSLSSLFAFLEKNGAYLRYLVPGTLAPDGEELKKIVRCCPNLEYLDICCENITNPEDLLCINALTELKSLELFACATDTFPCFNRLLRLETLRITGFHNLETLPSFDHWIHLQKLVISECECLTQLPCFDQLVNLRKLEISDCGCLAQLPSLDQLESLRTLLIFCVSLTSLPSLDFLTNLQCLGLHSSEITQYPSLDQLARLRKLEIYMGDTLIPFPSLNNLISLQWLHIRAHPELIYLPTLNHLSNLKHLILEGECLQVLPLDQLFQLQELTISSSTLTELPSLDHLTQLKKLTIDAPELIQVPSLDQLSQLQELSISSWTLTELPSLACLTQLKKLTIHASSLDRFPSVSALQALNELSIRADGELIVPHVTSLPNLNRFSFNGKEKKLKLEHLAKIVSALLLITIPGLATPSGSPLKLIHTRNN
jgi:hypothetical protein